MATAFYSAHRPGVVLFDEDFDLPMRSDPADEPEVIEPLYTAAELNAAREQAARAGREAAFAEIQGSDAAAASLALTTIADQIGAAKAEARSIAEHSAEAIARLLLGCFATAFPALSARHGPGEAAAMIREILPALHREVKITIRINPHVAAALTQELHAMETDMAAHVRLVPTDAMAPGDARVTWENGAATRDAVSLWNQIENILAPAGLLNTEPTVKEYAVGE